ncbi:MAG: sigma-70 family RNA polymerase sigma factor [Sphingobacteriales bacterium]|nr:sigma-70 family RNA polymerase sigma factor [Sphingobacteriales bacterium]
MSNKINHSKPTDNEIILGILNNSSTTLKYLYKAYFPMILQLVMNNNGNEDEAKDIYQEGIIILHDKIKSGDFELTSKLKTFLYSVCRRLWLKRLSHKSRFSENIKDYEDHFPVETELVQHEEKDQQLAIMHKALVELGEPCKTIIEDFYMHSKSMQDICEKFGYTNADNAKTQKYKCLQRLKKLFFSQK